MIRARATSDALMARGLTLGAVSREDGGKDFNEYSKTCIYMIRPRPHEACHCCKLSMKELSDIVLRLVKHAGVHM